MNGFDFIFIMWPSSGTVADGANTVKNVGNKIIKISIKIEPKDKKIQMYCWSLHDQATSTICLTDAHSVKAVLFIKY